MPTFVLAEEDQPLVKIELSQNGMGVFYLADREAVRSGDGGLTVTVCEDKAGTDESSRRAAEFVRKNLGVTSNPPTITVGSTELVFRRESGG